MIGRIDSGGRALLGVTLKSEGLTRVVDVWIDTGFTGDLVLPQTVIDEWQLPHSGSVDAVLADGSQIELRTYSCEIDWFGRSRPLEVISNEGEFPLLGVGLLLGRELHANYRTLTLSLTPVE